MLIRGLRWQLRQFDPRQEARRKRRVLAQYAGMHEFTPNHFGHVRTDESACEELRHFRHYNVGLDDPEFRNFAGIVSDRIFDLFYQFAPPSLNQKTKELSRKTFLGRIIYALDPKFERYITPQIIRVFWVLSLVLALLAVMIYALGNIQTALPRRIAVPNARPDEVV